MATLADEFRGFCGRLRSINLSSDRVAANAVIWEIGIEAARAFKRAVDAGLIDGFEDLHWPQPVWPPVDDNDALQCHWWAIVGSFAAQYPDRINSNPQSCKWQPLAEISEHEETIREGNKYAGSKIIVRGESVQVGTSAVEDWPIRAQRFAAVCEVIAELIDSKVVAETVATEPSEAAGAGEEKLSDKAAILLDFLNGNNMDYSEAVSRDLSSSVEAARAMVSRARKSCPSLIASKYPHVARHVT